MPDPTLVEAPTDLLAGILEPDASILASGDTPAILADTPQTKAADKAKEVEVKPAEKKEEVKEVKQAVEDDDTPQVDPNEKSDRWKKFVPKYEEKKALVKTLKEQLTDFEGTRKERDELKTRIEALEATNKELGKIDSLAKLENHPDFKRKYEIPEKASVENIKKFAGIADVPAEEILAALNKPLKERYTAIDNLLSSVTPTLRNKIQNEINQIEGYRDGRAAELATAQETLSKLNQQRQDAERSESANETKARTDAFDMVATKMAKELGLDDAAVKKAKEFFLGNDNLERAVEIVLKGQAANKSKELQTKLDELEKELAEYRKGGGSLRSGDSTTTSEADEKLDIGAFFVKKAREMGGIR